MLEGTWGAFSLTVLKCADVFIFTVKTVIRLFLLTNSPHEQGKLVYMLLGMQLFMSCSMSQHLSLKNITYQPTTYLGFLICPFLFYFSLCCSTNYICKCNLQACTIHTQINLLYWYVQYLQPIFLFLTDAI